jgi:hypothetical protein
LIKLVQTITLSAILLLSSCGSPDSNPGLSQESSVEQPGSVTIGLSNAESEQGLVGQLAPNFTLAGSDGAVHTLSEHVGENPVVLAFFPKAFTMG